MTSTTRIHYETKGQGKPLLFLHAGVADSRMWDEQFEQYSSGYYVIRCDLRGFGRSPKAPGSFTHFDDIAALLRRLDVGSVTVIGASFGGAVAIDLALAYPELVSGLILVAPALGGYRFTSAEMHRFFEQEEEALAQGDLAAATELNVRMWVDGFDRRPEAVNDAVRIKVREMQYHIFAQPDVAEMQEEGLEPPAIERLHTLTIPTLVLAGAHDAPEFRSIATLIARRIPQASVHMIAGAAHLPSMERPDEFARHMAGFLGSE